MENNNKKEPWRIAVGIISILFIVVMWSVKDIAAVYSATAKEDILPMGVTNLAVSLLKVGIIAGVVFLIRWIIKKIKAKK